MTFCNRLMEENLPIWEQCLNSAFLQKLGEGTLPWDCFKGYIVDDSLYLREYAKVFAWGMAKAEDMEEIRTYYELLSFVNEGEGATRLCYLERLSLTDAVIQRLPQRPENLAYTRAMIATARDGAGAAECMMACLPCMVSYGWVLTRLLERFPGVGDTPYWPLVRDYAGAEYRAACERWAAFTEKICTGLEPARERRCAEIFRACSVHELRFWEMSGRPREDI